MWKPCTSSPGAKPMHSHHCQRKKEPTSLLPCKLHGQDLMGQLTSKACWQWGLNVIAPALQARLYPARPRFPSSPNMLKLLVYCYIFSHFLCPCGFIFLYSFTKILAGFQQDDEIILCGLSRSPEVHVQKPDQVWLRLCTGLLKLSPDKGRPQQKWLSANPLSTLLSPHTKIFLLFFCFGRGTC